MKKISERSTVLAEQTLHQSKWVKLTQAKYLDEEGTIRDWEVVHRHNHSDAVIIVAQLEPSRKYILIRQYRPPAQHYVLEFPAGLIDSGETPEQTAIRELQEETGFCGIVQQVSPRVFSSPGLLAEACYYVLMTINENLVENQNPLPVNEPEEWIEVCAVHPSEIPSLWQTQQEQGVVLDGKLFAFFHDYFLNGMRT